jgi:hypothetical protein
VERKEAKWVLAKHIHKRLWEENCLSDWGKYVVQVETIEEWMDEA